MEIPIKFKSKPSEERIKEYTSKIEYYLSSLKVKVELIEYDQPIDIHSYINGKEIETHRYWFKGFLINGPYVKNLDVRMFDHGIPDKDLTGVCWIEAYLIQGHIYQSLNKDPGHPKDNDPYWDLWDKIKK